MSEHTRCFVFGATGAVGTALVNRLIDEGHPVEVVVRKSKQSWPEGVVEHVIKDQRILDELDLNQAHVFVAIGTTKAKTPDKERYYQIDHDIPVAASKRAQECKALTFHVVSSIGANPESSIFYSATKGEMERDVRQILPDAYIYRPSLLLAQRNERRLGEQISAVLNTMFGFLLPRSVRGISVEVVARCMARNAESQPEQKEWNSREIYAIGSVSEP